MYPLPAFTPDVDISLPKEVEMTGNKLCRDNSAIDMVKGVAGADNSRRASRLRRQRLKTTPHLEAPAACAAATITKTGEYIRRSSNVAEEIRIKSSSSEPMGSENPDERSPLNGRKQGWNHARACSYGSLITMSDGGITPSLLGDTDSEHGVYPVYPQHAKAAVNSWNMWMKLYISLLLAIFLTFGLLLAMRKAGGGYSYKAVDRGDDGTKSSGGTSTEIPSFWYTLVIATAVGFADLIFGGGFSDF